MNINLIGIGLGNPNLLTKAAYTAISNSNIIIGAKRIVESIKSDFSDKTYFTEYNTEKTSYTSTKYNIFDLICLCVSFYLVWRLF